MRRGEAANSRNEGFFQRDTTYFRESQYVTTSNLDSRVSLHEKYSTAPISWFEWLVSQIDWSNARDVLDVGCGTGLLWTHVPPKTGKRIGLTLADLSQAMVDTAISRAKTNIDEIQGLTTDVTQLPFGSASFDLVLANHMLYHVANPSDAISEIARVLRPNGLLVASTNGTRHLQELYDIDTAVFGVSEARNNNAEVFGSVTGLPLLRKYFSNVEWRSHEDSLCCTDPGDIVTYLRSVPPGESASTKEILALHTEVGRRVTDGNGALIVSKEAGVFFARNPFPVPST